MVIEKEACALMLLLLMEKGNGSKLSMFVIWYYITAAHDVVLNMPEISVFFWAYLPMLPNTDGILSSCTY